MRDFAIIERVEVDLADGLTVLTGETGTGKSILLGALQLLLGDRASTDQVRQGAERSLVEGTFVVPGAHPVRKVLDGLGVPVSDDFLIVRREVSAEGRSRAYLNDVSVTVGALKQVGETLVDLHGQHEHQSLLRPRQHLLLLDAWAGLDRDREAYRRLLEEEKGARGRLEQLRARIQERSEKIELYEYQLQEIEAIDPREGELEELESELRVLEGAERLIEGTIRVQDALAEGHAPLVDRMDQVASLLAELAEIDERLANLSSMASDALVAMEEIVHGSQRYTDTFELDEEELLRLRERHAELVRLSKKYGGTLEAMLARRRELEHALSEHSRAGEDISELEEEAERLRAEVSERAIALHEARTEAVRALEERVLEELRDLNMPDADFQVALDLRKDPEGGVDIEETRCAAGPTGIDRVEFRIRTNPGAPLMPLQKVASGGEISRIMLSLKGAFGKASEITTLVFDEIDSGIGGRTADRVGAKLEALAEERQVLVITHLPQIARRGGRHLVVEKDVEEDSARTRIRPVTGDERTEALAVLMGGEEAGEAVHGHARELLGVSDDEGEGA